MDEEDFDPTECCLPLRSMMDIHYFMQEPPAWRTLCKPLTPHSTKVIKNIDLLNVPVKDITLEKTSSFCHYDPDNDNVVRHDENTVPRTLVCHDMANGYHDDCLIDGSANYDNYMFYNWAGVDVFCYFSHYLLTVPPLGWINVAHAHGVRVIGTLITEWGEGSKFWEEVLQSEEQTQTLISYLVTIARTLKFEGWLLNVENKVSAPAQLLHFVARLHRTLHAEVPHAVLLWYDSVTVGGDLYWQNKLNHLNKPFFDACDGIFTNYSWSEEDVRSSLAEAGERRADVYVGIDVWGRNFYGGGMFNTQAAVRFVHAHSGSLAVFAPAWTHEACPEQHERGSPQAVQHAEGLSRYERFRLRDLALWGSLWPFLNTRPPCRLPFQTSFCTGHGLKRRMYGEVLVNSPWFNLRHMQYQPNSIHGAHRYRLSPGEPARERAPHADPGRGILKLRDSFAVFTTGINGLAGRRRDPTANEHSDDPSNAMAESSGNPNMWVKCKTVWKTMTNKKKKPLPAEEGEGAAAPLLGGERSTLQISLRRRGERAARPQLALVAGAAACLDEHLADSFAGGSCLLLQPAPPSAPAVRLLHADFYVQHSLIVCVATKSLSAADHHLTLLLQGHRESDQSAKQCVELVCHASAEGRGGWGGRALRPLAVGGAAFRDLQVHLLLTQPEFYVPVENSYGWDVFYFEIPWEDARVTCVGARPGGALLLGHLGLCARAPAMPSTDPGSGSPDPLDLAAPPVPPTPSPDRTEEDR